MRILPLYWIGVTVVWAIRNPALPGDWVDLLEHLHVHPGLRPAADLLHARADVVDVAGGDLLRRCWSCSAPLAVRACRRLGSRRRRVTAAAGRRRPSSLVVPLVWNAVAFLALDIRSTTGRSYFGPQARFGAFAAGMPLAVIAAARRSSRCSAVPARPCCAWLGAGHRARRGGAIRPGTWGQVVFHDIAAVGWFLLMASTVLGAPGPAVVPGALLARADLARPDQLQHLHVARAGDDAARALRAYHRSRRPGAAVSRSIVLARLGPRRRVSYRVIEQPTGKLRMLRDRDGRPREYYPELVDRPQA